MINMKPIDSMLRSVGIPALSGMLSLIATTGTIGWTAEPVPRMGTAADWPQWGGSPSRNEKSPAADLPVEWNVGQFDLKTGRWLSESAENVKWVARLGSESYGSPVIAGGRVFCATNNGAGYLDRYPADVDLGCLLAFDQTDGRFLWQHSTEKLKAGRYIDYPEQGICCSPLIQGDRLWVVTNRGEVVCLDTAGFGDGENDGPFQSEASDAENESDVVWIFDMMRRLGTVQRYGCSCSVTAAGDLLLVCTSNGVDSSDENVPAPEAPSFIALDKNTGELVWGDNSPGENILDGQWASPSFAVLGGVPQAIFPGGNGWVYSFLAEKTDDGKAQLLWKFDCNPKEAQWKGSGFGDRNNIIATPVIHQGKVYIATGQDPEAGEGQGDLWCIDPTRRGDTSAQKVVDGQGNPVAPRRTYAVDEAAGEKVVPNPNSAAVWHYRGVDADGDGQYGFEETMHRAMGMVAIRDGLLVIGDYAGLVHCLDPQTGSLHWTHDMLATVWGSPTIADGKIYLGDEDGDLAVFEASKQLKLLGENNMGNSVYSTPVGLGKTLYVSTRSHLFAIEK
jgi:outer membrane protein assembly factor BamB